MRRNARARILAGVVGLAVLVGVGSSPAVQMTDAAFTDSEYAAGSFTAATLAKPVVTSCTVTSFLGTFTGFTIDREVSRTARSIPPRRFRRAPPRTTSAAGTP